MGIDSSVLQLRGVVHGVRRRWRASRVLRGGAIALAGIVLTLIFLALMLDAFAYSTAAVITARFVFSAVTLGLVGYFVVLPLLPRPRDEQVALYVEEHEPSLEGALVSAVEVSGRNAESSDSGEGLTKLLRRVALDRARAVNDGRAVDRARLRGAGMGLAATLGLLTLVLALDPRGVRYGMGALLTPWRKADEVNPFRLDVTPGDATVARGASVVITARAIGYETDGAELWARTSDSTAWTRVPMTGGGDSSAHFTARLLDVSQATEYVVETSGLRSRVFRLKVAELPYTKRIDLEYHYPAYTGLAVNRVDSTGDIVAPAGTMVHVRVTPTLPTHGGRLVLDGGDTLALSPAADGTLETNLRVRRGGFYRVELEGARGDLLTASLNYAIDVLPDRAPTVRFVKPGRDSRVLAVDEVYTEARAEDDYGVAKLDLVYSVNGDSERVAPLHRATRNIKEIAAGHTFMLEDYSLQPGDVVSYYARATDNDAVNGAKSTTSDIYFLQVRPYSQEYRQAQEGGGGGAGGGQGESPGQLSQRQREIIAGTFNSGRDSATAERRALEEDIATLRLSQQRLREDVEQLAQRLVSRGVASTDSNFARIAEILPVAAAAMDTAERTLASNRLRDALQPEQRALQQLQRAEAVFKNIRVAMGGQQGGGGGGGQQSPAEDLADLFELQRERLRNQYETVQRGQDEQQQAQQQEDATAERLRQLAARQQQENERARRKADSLSRMGAAGATGGQSQRQLAQETEQAARQLERLARERESQSLADAARQLNQAADAMRRSAASGQNSQRGAADAADALNRLRDARRLIDQERDDRAQRAVEDAVATGRRLADEQRRVTDDVERQNGASDQEREQLLRSIAQRKGAMADSARDLAGRLDRAAQSARQQAAVARKITEAADTLRDRHIEDKLRITQQRLRGTTPEYQKVNEGIITSDIDRLNRALEDARVAVRDGRTGNDERRTADAMDRARNLVRGMESLDERAGQTEAGGGRREAGGESRGKQSQPGGGGITGSRDGGGGGGGAGGGGAQFGRELRERLNDARALRRDLSNRGVDMTELDRSIKGMESLARGAGGSNRDARAERELRGQVIEGLRSFEFALGSALGGAARERVLVDRSGEVPPQYRKYVEEYYRALGRAKPPR